MATNDPATLSAQLADDAVELVHSREEVAPDAGVEVHADPKVPGANFVDGTTVDEEHARYWVGLRGDVEPTQVHDPVLRRNPAYSATRRHYSAAVEAVRSAYRIPVPHALHAVPDDAVEGAFFVHGGSEGSDAEGTDVVRWVHPGGEVYDGYRQQGEDVVWEERGRAARDALLGGDGRS